MSRLDDLIRELCPEGVDHKRLGEVATISRGGNFQKKDYVEKGIPCIHYGQIYTRYSLFVHNTVSFISNEVAARQKYAATGDIIIAVTSENMEDVCKCVAWLGKGDIAVSGHTAIIHHTLDPKYLVYYFHSNKFFEQKRKMAHGTKVIEVTPDKLADIMLPVPPLEVQREIVRILDNFTELTAELSAELTAELTARKKQYEYYRERILTFSKSTGNNIKWLKLKDIATCFRGEYITKKSTTPGSIPVILGGQEPAYFINVSNHDGEIIIIARSGASAGFVSYWNEPIFVTDGFGYEARQEIVSFRFLYYILKNREGELNKMKRGAGVPHVSGEALENLTFPVPSLEEQHRIVSILDRFDTLCTDLTSGLPAEIAARQKQYEYYRDKLLTFKELA